jgi:cytochrome c-type biogenesis protein CcmH/NrfF
MTTRPLFSAKCGHCSASFGYPSLGDFDYASLILSTEDGQRFAYVDASASFPSRLSLLLKSIGSHLQFWDALASLADQLDNRRWVIGIRCPQCGSANITSWDASRCGDVEVPEATFIHAAGLSDQEICDRLKAL